MNDRAAAPGIDAVRRAMTADDDEPLPQPRPSAEVTRFAPLAQRSTPAAQPPSLDNVSDLVAKGINALVEEHRELLERAKVAFLQVESCLESASKARETMLSARQEALGKCEAATDA